MIAVTVLLVVAGIGIAVAGEEEPVEKETATREVPPIDREAPEKVETATFGLG